MRPQCDGSFFLRCRTAGANFYNVFNHPNFANPVNGISSGQFGTIQSTVVPPTSPYGKFVGSAVSGRLIQW